MTGRVQTLRSNVSGSRPTGRQPGEIYVNWADGQIGVINSSNGAQDFVAVRFFSTTANYNTGDFVIQGGQLYRAIAVSPAGAFVPANWAQIGGSVGIGVAPSNPQPGTLWWDSVSGQLFVWYNDGDTSQWVIANNATALLNTGFLPLAGGTLTGPLTLAGNPATALQATPKQYVDSLPVAMNDNRIINGDMRIDQRNQGASGTASLVYTVDRWFYQANQTSKGTWGRGPSGVPGFPYYLGFTSSSAYASLAADIFGFNHRIEADMVSDFAWGTASAQDVTLSFWAFPSLSGTFSGSVRNYAGDRSYPFTFPLTANTWTKTVIVIPGDTAGTWVLSGNAGAVILNFDLGSGSNSRGPANAWAAGNYFGATGAVNVVAVNGAYIYFTGVKLEIGSVATPFNRQSLAKSLADCQRYYALPNSGIVCGSIYTTAAGMATYQHWEPPVTMRAAPTVVGSWNNLVNATAGSFTSSPGPIQGFITSVAAGPFSGSMLITSVTAEL